MVISTILPETRQPQPVAPPPLKTTPSFQCHPPILGETTRRLFDTGFLPYEATTPLFCPRMADLNSGSIFSQGILDHSPHLVPS
jgi:hypothetical protein